MALQSKKRAFSQEHDEAEDADEQNDPTWDGECRTCWFTAVGEQVWGGVNQRRNNAGYHAQRRHERRCPNAKQGADATSPYDATDTEQPVTPRHHRTPTRSLDNDRLDIHDAID